MCLHGRSMRCELDFALLLIHRTKGILISIERHLCVNDQRLTAGHFHNHIWPQATAFAIGDMFGGFAGCFIATRQGFVSPESFVFIESAIILAIVVLGGLGSQIGIVFAAIAIMGSFELFRELSVFQEYLPEGTDPVHFRMLAVGLAMVLMMRFRPRGFVTRRQPTVFLKERKAVSGDLVKEGHG